MRAGDVVLYHATKPSPMVRLIWFTTGSRWNHAALAVSPHVVIEATGKGVARNLVTNTRDQTLALDVPYASEADRLQAVAWATARAGVRYGYLNAFMCGVNGLLAGMHLAIKKTDSIICSELVAESFERAGLDIGKDSSQVSPGDLAEFLDATR